MENFAAILAPRISEALDNKCIKTLILRNSERDMNKAKKNISLMHTFVDNLADHRKC